MNDINAQKRWNELRFYFICVDLARMSGNTIIDIMTFIEYVGAFTPIRVTHIKQTANEMIASMRFKPTKTEMVLISRQFGVPIERIRRRTGLHNKTIYKYVHENEKDPVYFYPRLNETQHEYIAEFLTAFDKLREVGA